MECCSAQRLSEDVRELSMSSDMNQLSPTMDSTNSNKLSACIPIPTTKRVRPRCGGERREPTSEICAFPCQALVRFYSHHFVR